MPSLEDGGIDAGQDGGCQPTNKSCYTGPQGTNGLGICHPGVEACRDGQLVCLGEVLPSLELCNGLDDDCNGRVDDIPHQTCYDAGPPDTEDVGLCHGGYQVCGQYLGVWSPYCANEVGPTPAQCDGLDHQCTGHIPQTQGLVDIVFILDNTGSACEDGMGVNNITQAQTVISQFAQTMPPNYHLAEVLAPSIQVWAGWGQSIGSNPPVFNNCNQGEEPFYGLDLVYDQAWGNPLPWEQGAQRAIVVFTADEAEGLRASGSVVVSSLRSNQVQLLTLFSLTPNPSGDAQPGGYSFGTGTYVISWGTVDEALEALNQDLVFPCDGGS